ncbi:hypothetical protein BGX21_003503 [Mortierella sp. AD011]|nr:hypothetical protein BGX20_011118 [Mortierella sp. AD010]KAF9376355.1 hypothetical protein BGX21_003503 [Mortierella sp. AD011]
MTTSRRPRRFTIMGVPITPELTLRFLLLMITIAALIVATRPKVMSILQQARVVGVTVTNELEIPAPSMLICSPYLDTVQIQGIVRRNIFDNGTIILQRTFDLLNGTDLTYTIVNVTQLNLRDTTDWPSSGKCLDFRPFGVSFGQNTAGSNSNTTLDTISIELISNTAITAVDNFGLDISMWDGNVKVQDALPIGNAIPSLNFITFVYSEHVPVTGAKATRYAMTKQNLRTMNLDYFSDSKFATINFSPDTFYVSRFLDRPSYTWADLIGAVGGMASIGLAVWIFLFGNGKYKSWGIMQRYVLRTSPDSKKDRDDEAPKTMYQRIRQFLRDMLTRFDSSTDDEIDNLPLQSRKRQSLRFSTNMETVGGASAVATGSGKGTKTEFGEGYDPRHSIDSYGAASNYYFSDQGAPGSYSLRPLAPIGEGEDDAEEQVSELIQLIDLRIDEKMWSLERTLSRYYLDGFRLRNYSIHDGSGGDQFYFSRDSESGANPLEDDGAPLQPKFDLNKPTPRTPSPPASPPRYPPRPRLNQQLEVIDQILSSRQPPVPRASRPGITETINSSSPPQSSRQPLSSGFPQRRDVRGTIRRAVERLQSEWPQSHTPESYVPRTQYQSENGNSIGATPSGYSSVNINPADEGNNNPPGY